MKLPSCEKWHFVIVQVVCDVLKDWSASSYGQESQQKAHLSCLTLKMETVQSLERYLPYDSIPEELNIQ